MSERSTCWSITINNPTPDDREQLNRCSQKGWRIEGQQEVGENGTLHYQCLLRTPQVRFNAVKNHFTRAHIDIARNVSALERYVHKEETRVGDLPLEPNKYPSLSRYWGLVYTYCVDNLLLDCAYPHRPVWYKTVDVLGVLDEATDYLIREGYHVETLCVNPQTRSAFLKFALAIFRRAYVDRQTDRQQTVEVPTEEVPRYNIDIEHNNVDSPS